MLGHAVMRTLFDPNSDIEVYGAARYSGVRRALSEMPADRFVIGFDAEKIKNLIDIFARIQPDVVLNCIGVVKQLEIANDPLTVLRLIRCCHIVCTAFAAPLEHV